MFENRVKKLEDDKNEEDGRCTGACFCILITCILARFFPAWCCCCCCCRCCCFVVRQGLLGRSQGFSRAVKRLIPLLLLLFAGLAQTPERESEM
mmetsp:Transcript_62060/g.100386  ORF Transcript_62060/g.100386 Transcript_62060/m.100386 type:complete len:94 (-) Transcript_62060:40-321(-)